MDTVSAATRSRIMASIRGRDTHPEIVLRRALSIKGYRYRKNYRIGRKAIDIAFVRKKVAVFVDGCFWHGCRLHAKRPKSNLRYWNAKIRANVKRDKITDSELKGDGWHVIRVWEHQVKKSPEAVAMKIGSTL